mgnify:CR=1 FL=1
MIYAYDILYNIIYYIPLWVWGDGTTDLLLTTRAGVYYIIWLGDPYDPKKAEYLMVYDIYDI